MVGSQAYHAHSWLNALVRTIGAGTAGALSLGMSTQTIVMVSGIMTAIGGAGAVYVLGQSVAEDLRHKFKR